MRYINRALGRLRSSAKTVGLSPKILAPAIGSAITALLALAGLTPHDLAHAFGVSDEIAAAALITLAAHLAAWLLPPGNVVNTGEVGPASDDLLAGALNGAPTAPADQLWTGRR